MINGKYTEQEIKKLAFERIQDAAFCRRLGMCVCDMAVIHGGQSVLQFPAALDANFDTVN